MATGTIPYVAPLKLITGTGHTNAYGLMSVSNANKLHGIVITDPVQCIPLYYSSSGIRVLKVTETSGTFSFAWLANTDVTYNAAYT